MKEVNAYYRKYGTCKGASGMSDTLAETIDRRIKTTTHPWETVPFPSYDLSGNSAEIKRLQKRIGEIIRNREVGFKGWKFEGGEAIINNDLNRLQLFFDEKPNSEKCAVLKRKGFHWSPREGAWQRQLNDNAIYAVNHVDFVKPLDGRKPTDLQPKASSRDTGER